MSLCQDFLLVNIVPKSAQFAEFTNCMRNWKGAPSLVLRDAAYILFSLIVRCRLSQMTAFCQHFQGGRAATGHSVNSIPSLRQEQVLSSPKRSKNPHQA